MAREALNAGETRRDADRGGGKRAAIAWLEHEAIKQLGIYAIEHDRNVRTSWLKRSVTGLPSTACPALMRKADRRQSNSWSVWCGLPSVRARWAAMTSLAAVRVVSLTCCPASGDAMNQGFSSSVVAMPTRIIEPG